MKKYNLSEIMKNAWGLRRKLIITMSAALKKAWAIAKSKEEITMENSEIKALIDKYGLFLDWNGERVGARKLNTKGISREKFIQECGPHKAEIIAYFKAERKAKEDLWAKRAATFDAIPGVVVLRQARAQRAEWQREFNRMMEEGNGRMPQIKAPTPQEMDQLEARYPIAVFALQAESRARSTVNAELLEIWKGTYNALCDGQDPEAVKADHDKRMEEYANAHIWD